MAHDDVSYPSDGRQDDLYSDLKRKNMFVPTDRSRAGSTTDIISRLLKNRNQFLTRNLRRGVAPEDLGLSLEEAKRFGPKKTGGLGDVSHFLKDWV